MHHLGFESRKADPDVCMRAAKKKDGTEYWDYAPLYTYDVLVVSESGEQFLRNELGKYFDLKGESIGPPNIYFVGRGPSTSMRSEVLGY